MTFEDPTWVQGTAGTPSYSAREDRLVIDSLWDEGVLGAASFKVTQNGGGAMSVVAGLGKSVIKGDDQTNQGAYIARCTVAETLTIAAAPGANSRYDLVVVEVNDPNATNVRTPANVSEFKVISGTVAASPVVPTLPPTAIPIAVIGPITPSTSAVTTAMIFDITNWASAPAAAQAVAQVSRQNAGDKAAAGSVRAQAGPYAPSGWLLAYGQSVTTANYPDLFAEIGYSHGGSGASFNLPDYRGRSLFGLDNMGGTDAGRLAVANTLGLAGGAETVTLSTAELAVHAHTVDPPSTGISASTSTSTTVNESAHTHPGPSGTYGAASFFTTPTTLGFSSLAPGDGSGVGYSSGGNTNTGSTLPTVSASSSSTTSGSVDIAAFSSANAGSGAAHNNMPPYALVNYVIRT